MSSAGSSLIPRAGVCFLLLACAGGLLLGGRYLLREHLAPVIEEHHQALHQSQQARLDQALDAHMDSLILMAREYAEWDSMRDFALDPAAHPDFIGQNIYAESWPALSIELLLILDASGELLWGQLIDSDGESVLMDDTVTSLFADNPLLSSSMGVQSHTRGLLDTEAGIAMIVSAPITRTDGSGPSAGSFVVGSLLNNARLEQFSRAADTTLALFPLADPNLSARIKQIPIELEGAEDPFIIHRQPGQLYLVSQLRDLYGKPLAVVQAKFPDDREDIALEALARVERSWALMVGFVALLLPGVFFLLRPRV